MKNIAQKISQPEGSSVGSRGSTPAGHHIMDLPRALLGYLGKMALSDEDLRPGSEKVKNRIRGRIAYK
jgi:hypothetical protein